jgi:hypothetical protein
MKIYMSQEQKKKLAEFLHRKKSLKALALGREYYWREMADDIGLTEETLRHLKDKKGGMNLETFTILNRAFKREFLDALGIDPDGEPSFKL